MSTTYYVEETHDGGWAVQRVEDGHEDFYSYHLTQEEAQASLANAYKREAADDLFAICATLLDVPECADWLREEWPGFFLSLRDAVAKAKGGAV